MIFNDDKYGNTEVVMWEGIQSREEKGVALLYLASEEGWVADILCRYIDLRSPL